MSWELVGLYFWSAYTWALASPAFWTLFAAAVTAGGIWAAITRSRAREQETDEH